MTGGVATRPSGVYLSTDNGATWNPAPINPNSNANPGRIALAVSDTANQVVYRFDEPGRLWRFDGAQFQRVQGLPPAASTVGSQGYYDLAVAVQPGTDDDVYLAASLILNNVAGQLNPSEWEAAFYRSTLTVVGGNRQFGYTNGANPDRSPLWIGAGIHADCHTIAFARNAAGNALRRRRGVARQRRWRVPLTQRDAGQLRRPQRGSGDHPADLLRPPPGERRDRPVRDAGQRHHTRRRCGDVAGRADGRRRRRRHRSAQSAAGDDPEQQLDALLDPGWGVERGDERGVTDDEHRRAADDVRRGS